jgi:ABC-2 type transport system permease protein
MTSVAVQDAAVRHTAVARIPTTRVVGVELRKMLDTRSGFWLMASIGIAAVLATGAVLVFAPDDQLTYNNFAAAIGFPMSVILPMVAILSVTSEWTQRSGLTTFTFVPDRGRVIGAKALACVTVGIASMLLAFGIGALGNLAGTAIAGAPVVWDIPLSQMLDIVLANVLGMMLGFTLGVLIRNSPGAIVAYFVYSLVLPTLAGILAAYQSWFADLQPWVDFNFAQTTLFDGGVTSTQWAHLAVTGVLWLAIPLVVGLTALLRTEVK